MSTVKLRNVTITYSITDRTNPRRNMSTASQGTTSRTKSLNTSLMSKVTENKTKIVSSTTIGNGKTAATEGTETTTTEETTITEKITTTETFTAQTVTTTVGRNGTTTRNVTNSPPTIATEGLVTGVTSTKVSHPGTGASSTKTLVTIGYTSNSTKFPFSNSTFNTTASNRVVSTKVDDSAMGLKRITDDCTETIAIVSGLCAGLVILNLLVSVLCFFRLRHKWRAKIQLERKKTDIWSMATYNNTIINENFNDYQLASSTSNKSRKTSRFSEDSIHFYDPYVDTMSQSRFAPNHDDIAMRNTTLPPEAHADFSTLRRNTVSAPEELDSKLQTLRIEPDNFGFNDDRNTLRGRSSTFTVGRKNNVDRHVLLSHEELVDQAVIDVEQTGSRYNMRTNSYHITEL